MRLAGLLAACCALGGPGQAQDMDWRVFGIPSRNLAMRNGVLGDINGDGYEDLALIVNGTCIIASGPYGHQGYLWILSGRDGTLLREDSVTNWWESFAAVAGTGDQNGDGVPDYLAARYTSSGPITYPPVVELRSGATGAVLRTYPAYGFNDVLVGDCDVDGDGFKDVVVGIQGGTLLNGEVSVYRHDGPLLYRLQGAWVPPIPLSIGRSLACVGDVDDDGADDFVMGCWESTSRGAAVVVSGRTGAYLHYCYGELAGDQVGFAVAACGDLDGDGYQEFAVGSRGNGFGSARSIVRVFSARTGQFLRQWVHPIHGAEFGSTLAGRGADFDGDGVPDLIIGAPRESHIPPPWPSTLIGAAYVYSGRDGSLLHRILGHRDVFDSQIGYFVNALRPGPGEARGRIVLPDYVAFVNLTCNGYLGALSVHHGLPRTARELGVPCASALADAPQIGMQSLGTAGVRVHLSRAPANSLAVLLLGLSTTHFAGVPLPASLDPLGITGCSLRTSIELMHVAVTSNVHPIGTTRLDVPLPIPVAGLGAWSISGQWWVLGDGTNFPGGMTSAVTWRR
jgi:hypothetical protein